MNNYNFDIKQLLDTFGGDPEKLANAFADALNDELAKQRAVNHIDNAAADVAGAWGCFVDEYFSAHDLPKGTSKEDFYMEPETIKMLLEICIKAQPYMSLFQEYIGKLEALGNEVKQETVVAAGKAQQEFADVMAKFFDKNGI